MAMIFAPIPCATDPAEEPSMVGFACQQAPGTMHFPMDCAGVCPMRPQQPMLDAAAPYPMQCSNACPIGCQVPEGVHMFAAATGPQPGAMFANGMATTCGGDMMIAMVNCSTSLSEQSASMPMPLGAVAEQPAALGFGGLAQNTTCCDDTSVGQLADQQQLWAAYDWGEEGWARRRGNRRRRRHRGGQDRTTSQTAPNRSHDNTDAVVPRLAAAAAAVVNEGFCDVDMENFPPICFARLPTTGKGRVERKPGMTTRTSSMATESTDAESDSGGSSAATAAAPKPAVPPRPSFLADSAAAAGVNGAMALAKNAELCTEILNRIKDGPRIETEEVLAWVLDDVAHLAQAPGGACRVVQKLLEVVSADGRDEIAKRLSPWTVELYESPHGNHVLAKLVEVLPSASLRPIVECIEQKGYLTVARHQFGCRILERLIEYGTEAEMHRLNDNFVGNAEQLCRHPYGNFVVQHLLEHGAAHRGAEIVRRLLPTISQLAMHRTASHVVQQALRHASEEGQQAIAHGLLWGASGKPLLEVATSRHGSYVVEDLQNLHCPCADQIKQAAKKQLLAAGPEQLGSAHFHRVSEAFELGFVVPPGVAANQNQERDRE